MRPLLSDFTLECGPPSTDAVRAQVRTPAPPGRSRSIPGPPQTSSSEKLTGPAPGRNARLRRMIGAARCLVAAAACPASRADGETLALIGRTRNRWSECGGRVVGLD